MATAIGSLNVKLGLSAAAFTSGLAAASSKVGGFASSVSGAFAAVAAGPAGIASLLGGIGAGGIGSFIKGAFEAADAAGDLASKLGVSVTALTELQHAAIMSDVSTESLSTGLGKFSKIIGDAEAGSAEAIGALNMLGLSAQDLAGKDLTASFGEAAEVIASLGTPTQQASAAVKLFGKTGQELLPLLRQGKDGIAEFANEAKRLGVSLSQADSDKVQAADEAIKRAQQSIAGIGRKLAVAFAPLLEKAAEAATSIMAWLQPALDWLIDAFGVAMDIGAELWDVIVEGAKEFLPVLDPIMDWFGEWGVTTGSARDFIVSSLRSILKAFAPIIDVLKMIQGALWTYFVSPILKAVSVVTAKFAELYDVAGQLPGVMGSLARSQATNLRMVSGVTGKLSEVMEAKGRRFMATEFGDTAKDIDAFFDRVAARGQKVAPPAKTKAQDVASGPEPSKAPKLEFAKAALRGSKEAFDVFLASQIRGASPQDKMLAVANGQKVLLERVVRSTEETARLLRDGDPEVVDF